MINLNELDVEQLVSYEGYEYRVSNGKNGLQLNVKTCPRCRREDYKVYLNAESGLGNCFGCEQKYNRYTFVKLSRGFVLHSEVNRYLSSIAPSVSYRPKMPASHYKLNLDWKLPLNKRIELEEDVPEYLSERKVNAKLCKRFDIRICNNGFYEYEDFFDRKRFVDFSNRIIIPVYSIEDELVTFQGRDITGKSEKKYLFPNMLPGTGRYIYNANYALKNKAKKVVLSEGVFDVFATTRALETDIKYQSFAACGTFGKHLSIATKNSNTDDQLSDLIKLKLGGVDEFILMWDGERKALIAAVEVAIQLNGLGLYTTVAKLSDDLDPDETPLELVLAAIEKRSKPTSLDLMRMKLAV